MFRTEITSPPSISKISIGQPILCLGSCFADVIGHWLIRYKFDSLVNPFGVIYNPCSLIKLLEYSLSNRSPDEASYTKNQGIYYNYELHSMFSDKHLQTLQKSISETITLAANYLEKSQWIIFTFGTAFIHRLKASKELVANCHKMPADYFKQELLTIDQIVAAFDQFLNQLQQKNLNPKIIITVSPVRHLKSGLVNNNLSKATLRLAAQNLMEKHDQINYFPSYEIMMDDLRDYRYYEKDLVHPNEIAHDYIWKQFSQVYFDNETKAFINDWDRIIAALQHKPFHPESDNHQSFLKKTLTHLDSLKGQVDVSEELDLIQKQLL